jgi:cellulose synthase/poly-beta-1,6-N-acetylglucosamine synthase-like glycosyltransferase
MMPYYLHIIDIVLFVMLGVSVLYIFLFALFSLREGNIKYAKSTKNYKFAVFIPAYKEDNVIEECVKNVLLQEYPRECLEIIVIADQMSDEVVSRLSKLPIAVIIPKFEHSSKAAALKYAVEQIKIEFDIAVVLDADNVVEKNFLQDIADAFDNGMEVVQAHRIAKNTDTSVALLDACSEEINNAIFRKGQVAVGFSANLIGSGMAFKYSWFKDNVKKLETAGEDKELERLLCKDRIFVDFLNNTYVYDQKVSKSSSFYSQRRRWIASQVGIFSKSFTEFPHALVSGNFDYCNKIFQWSQPPRVIILGCVGIITCLTTIFYIGSSVKWWVLMLLIGFTFAFGIPDRLVDKKFKKAIEKVPLLGLMMFANLFRIRGVNKKFIHTEH